jgi:archaellum component FlaC
MNKKDLLLLAEAYDDVVENEIPYEISPEQALENEKEEVGMLKTSLENTHRKIEMLLKLIEGGHEIEPWMMQKLPTALKAISEVADVVQTKHGY